MEYYFRIILDLCEAQLGFYIINGVNLVLNSVDR